VNVRSNENGVLKGFSMKRRFRSLVWAAAAGAACTLGQGSLAQDGTAPSAEPVPSAQPGARGFPELMREFQQAAGELQPLMSSPDAIFDAAKRQAMGEKALPVLKRMSGLADEMSGTDGPGGELGKQIRGQVDMMLAVFDDADAIARLEKVAGNATVDRDEALKARGSLLFAQWVRGGKDAASQSAVLDEVEALAKANPESDDLAVLLMQFSEANPATPEIAARAKAMATDTLTSPMAKQIKEQLAADARLASLEGKPLTIAGPLHTGEPFSSEALKGKVVLVDFWATWCGPCIAELPRLKKIHEQYKEQGLAVVGVSCDENVEDLKNFLAKNPEMTWPQLLDANNPGWHALAKAFGVNGIPTLFLIDKQGVVRTVKARENMEELIPKLLAE
jgi:thiol-disulfide isomerase/thioredoxin